ncbi:hypothetical protein U1P98_19570 [Lysinibacillus irui]|uniref:Asp/Glu/hydantoin racemase n=1 Tax=Lysinibacillus irui TaxID=2998077 RepID=A0ABU5NR62_9BACI|nr:hypothetical protein [Lysinibacillus irui]MEA0552553.1 hypothetical protein [Lysinibacillus irui]MEA0978505.1 hypothetical protein [Lysinibacillus irui]MEA1044659.1 hypothetical protein [Lysinibacillus irui]
MYLKKRIGCLHAHYSNIEYIERTFQNDEDMELLHFVDPGVMQQVSKGMGDVARKVKEQIEWIASCDVDAILITCTNYIALLQDDATVDPSIPIIKIDELYFESICNVQQPITILFTNPMTVEGTMARLHQYAKHHEKSVTVVAKVIEHTFDLIMQGKKEAYSDAILQTLLSLTDEQRLISVAQLSMVDAAQQFEEQTAISVIHPLKPLVAVVKKSLGI